MFILITQKGFIESGVTSMLIIIINFRFQLNAQYLISIVMSSKCFGHTCAHPQEDLCIFTSGSMSV